MRRFDKKHNIAKVNLLAEKRHLESKGLITEGVQKTDSDIDELANEIIKRGNNDTKVENDLIIKTAAGDKDIQSRLTNRVSKLKNN
jgi:hypothetical protein